MKKIADKQINLSFSLFSFLRRGVGILLIVILASLLFRSYSKNEELIGLNVTLTDSLQIRENQFGELEARISAFQTQRTKDFINFATKDSLTKELQKDVKRMQRYLRKSGSVTKFSTTTEVDTKIPTKVSKDTAGFPTYNSSYNLNGWVYGDIVAQRDTTYIKAGIKNDYSVVIGIEPTGFIGLGKGKPFGQVTNKNPYSTVKTLKTYSITMPKSKRFGIGPYFGVDNRGNLGVGLGVSYDLIQF